MSINLAYTVAFQLTRPRGARRSTALISSRTPRFQLTRPRGARPFRVVWAIVIRIISTHAPTRSATVWKSALVQLSLISTHAPTRSATGFSYFFLKYLFNFNSRAHEERDKSKLDFYTFYYNFNSRAHEERDDILSVMHESIGISTHAPTRSATVSIFSDSLSTLFQLTRPRGARLRSCDCLYWLSYFNSRAHEERDFLFWLIFVLSVISTHAPTRSATGYSLVFACNQKHFNSRAHEERDIRFLIRFLMLSKFQLTRPRGARLDEIKIRVPKGQFQLTRPRGARHSENRNL